MQPIFHNVEQNSEEWFDLKAGVLSGSNISKVMAHYGKAFGVPAKNLAATIACEQVTGKRCTDDHYTNASMERGIQQEYIARELYESMNFSDVTNGGFFDNGNTGCSPDGLVDKNGVIEIKSVLAHVHYANIKRGCIDPAYKWQHYFNLNETGRDWIDFVSYCSDYPEQTRLFVFRTKVEDIKDDLTKMKSRIDEFFNLVEEIKVTIKGE